MIARRIVRLVPILLILGAGLPFARAVNPLAPPRCGTQRGLEGPATSARASLRVANFNVLHGNTEEPPQYPAHSTLDERLEISARQLASSGADVVGMQEVSETLANDLTKHAPGNVAQRLAARLAQLQGVDWHWCWFMANAHAPGEPDVQEGGGGPVSEMLSAAAYENYASFKEGAAVLSRYPIVAAEGRRLPSRNPVEHVFCAGDTGCHFTTVFESRVALGATIDTPGGRTQIVTMHLSNGITDATTVTTMQQMAAALQFSDELALADPPARRYLTCDCNVTEDAAIPVIPTVTGAGWTDTFRALHPDPTADPGFTGGSDIIVTASPKRSAKEAMFERIDYVFWRAGSCANPVYRSRVFMDAPAPFGGAFLWPSDHFGVLTSVSIRDCA